MTKKSAPKKKAVSKKSATAKKSVSKKSRPSSKTKVAQVFSKKPISAKSKKKTPPAKKSGRIPLKAKKLAETKKPAKKPMAEKSAPVKKQMKTSPKKSDAKISAKAQKTKKTVKKAPVKRQAAVKKPVLKQVKNTNSKSKSAVKQAKPAAKKQSVSKSAVKKPVPSPKAKPAPKVLHEKKPAPADAKNKSVRKSGNSVVEKASNEKSFVQMESRGKPAKTKHLRPSHNIYFSLEDVEAFFSRKDTSAVAISKEKSAVAAKTKSDKGKGTAKTVSNAPQKPLAVATIFDILGINPVIAKTHEKFEEKDVPRKWKKYYTLLVDLRKRFSSGVESRTEEVLKRSAKEDSGDLSSYGQHLADAGSESFERDMAYNLISNQKEILAEIEAAIGRIKDGSYGVCEVTGKPIPESRLTSIPYTRCTKEGQEIKETELKRQKAKQNSVSPYEMPSSDGTSSGGEDEAGS